jgi:sec-independent protein translocase protein TatC
VSDQEQQTNAEASAKKADSEYEDHFDFEDEVDGHKQPLIDHLIELRQRILRSIVFVGVLFLPLYYFANDIYVFVAKPLMANLPEGTSMIATEVASPFLTPFKLAIFSAIFLGMPFLLHQIWAFVSPGLYKKEKRFAMPLLVSSVCLFYLGMVFAYYVVFPVIFQFFASVTPLGVTMMTDISRYLDFVIKLFFAFGFAFEIPIATLLLVWSGISTADSLAAKRPFIIVGCFGAGMLLTPPDIISQVLLALPMWLLFEVGVLTARVVEKRAASAES